MEETSKYLDEEKYQRNAKKINNAFKIVLAIGIIIAALLVFFGVKQIVDTSKKTSAEGLASMKGEMESEAQILRNRKAELINKGVVISFDYNDEEGYELYLINKALDPSYSYCEFSDYQNQDVIRNYCSLKKEYRNYSENAPQFYALSVPFFVGALMVFMIFGSLSLQLLMISKGREIAAYGAQQGMPIIKEGAEKLGPTMEKTAKHITKGIKDGLKD